MFSLLGTIVVGLIVGILARFLLPGKENFPAGIAGILLTIVLGIAGAFVGTFVGRALGFSSSEVNFMLQAGSCPLSGQSCYC